MKGKLDSFGEKAIHDYLNTREIFHEIQFKIEGKNWEYDFYIPKLNLIVEVHGKQHYEQVKFFQDTYNDFLNCIRNDKAKKEYALKKGYLYLELDYRKRDAKVMKNKFKKIFNKMLKGENVVFPKHEINLKETKVKKRKKQTFIVELPVKENTVKKVKTKKEKIPKIVFESYDDNKMYSRNIGNFY